MSAHRPRVVFDCMIFLQAAARRASPSGACPALAEQGILELYISPAILAKVQDVIGRPQIRAKFQQLTDEPRDRDLLDGAASIAKTITDLRIVDPVTFLAAIRAQCGSSV